MDNAVTKKMVNEALEMLSEDSKNILLNPNAATKTYCRSSDALVKAGLWTNEGELTELGHAARERVRLDRYADSLAA